MPDWWRLGDSDRYLWDNLIGHLLAADGAAEAEELACDLRWAEERLWRFGVVAPIADLARVNTERARRMRRSLERIAHLLAPTDPPQAVVDVLHSRVADDQDWGPQVTVLRRDYQRTRLVNRWPLPDQSNSVIIRTLAGHNHTVRSLATAPDGTWLASASDDGTVRIWDVTSGRTIATFDDKAQSVAISPDGHLLATAGGYNVPAVKIWDVATGHLTTVLPGHPGGTNSLAFAPTGTRLATSGQDNTVRLWDLATGQIDQTLTDRTAKVDHLRFTPDGGRLAGGGEAFRVWDLSTGELTFFLPKTGQEVEALEIARSGGWCVLAVARTRNALVYDLVSGKLRAELTGHKADINSVVISPDGTWIATASTDMTLRIWGARTGKSRAVLTGHNFSVSSLVVAPDGSWLATGSGYGDGNIQIWDSSGRSTRGKPSSQAHAVAVSSDGSQIATGGDAETIHLWDTRRRRATTLIQRSPTYAGGFMAGITDKVFALEFAPGNQWLACISGDELRVWDLPARKVHVVSRNAYLNRHALAIAPDGTWFAASEKNNIIRFSYPGFEVLETLTGHTSHLNHIAISPCGKWMAGCAADAIRIWNLAHGKSTTIRVRALTIGFTPDSRYLAASDYDGAIHFWHIPTRRLQFRLPRQNAPVTSLDFAAGTGLLATANGNGAIHIWEPPKQQPISTMRVTDTAHACKWLPNTPTLAVGGTSGLYLFDLLTPAG
jgi:WD40 repeat protein